MSILLGTNQLDRSRLPHEVAWSTRYEYLKEHGYTLRPRYHPNWERSWLTSGVPASLSEDFVLLPANPSLIDATTQDGRLVYIKRLHHKDNERAIVEMLNPSTPPVSSQNHSVPVIEVIQPTAGTQLPPGDDSSTVYLVMPFLVGIHEAPFETVAQVVDLVEQLLEGLVYMHARGVAHRDCSVKNIMMDASLLYPKGFHPVQSWLLPDISGEAPRLPRSSARIRYYYIDYGISSYFDPSVDQDRKVVGIDGIDREVPELSATEPYDPFKVDVFLIGNLLKHEVYEKYKNLSFLEPLLGSMTAQLPAERPSASDAYAQWRNIRSKLPSLYRVWRLKRRTEGATIGFFLDAATVVRLAVSLPGKVAKGLWPF